MTDPSTVSHWDDYATFSAIVAAGTVRGAAQRLGVNPSTVTRRLDQFEARLGVKLFERTQRGLRPTADGEAIRVQVEQVALTLRDVEATLKAQDQEARGVVRFSADERLSPATILEHLQGFQSLHPQISITWVHHQAFDIRHVDAAIYVTDEPPVDRVGYQLGTLEEGLYATEDALDGQPITTADQDSSWLSAVELNVRASAAVLGIGPTQLPHGIASRYPQLQRADNSFDQRVGGIWLLAHPEQRTTTRIRHLVTYLREHW